MGLITQAKKKNKKKKKSKKKKDDKDESDQEASTASGHDKVAPSPDRKQHTSSAS